MLEELDCYFVGEEFCLSNYTTGAMIYNCYADLIYIINPGDIESVLAVGCWLRLYVKTPDLDDRKIIEKANNGLIISHNLHYVQYLYGLQKVAKNEYVFWSKNDDYFSVCFKSTKNVIEIVHGEKGNRKLKSDRTLKQFSKILCLANSVIQLYNL